MTVGNVNSYELYIKSPNFKNFSWESWAYYQSFAGILKGVNHSDMNEYLWVKKIKQKKKAAYIIIYKRVE